MKKIILIALAAVVVMAATFAIGYAAGKASETPPIAWTDSTGETYFAK